MASGAAAAAVAPRAGRACARPSKPQWANRQQAQAARAARGRPTPRSRAAGSTSRGAGSGRTGCSSGWSVTTSSGKGEEPEHYAGSKRGDSVPPASRTTRRGASAADSISTKPLVIQAFRYYGTSAHGPRVGKGWGVQRRTPIVLVLAALLRGWWPARQRAEARAPQDLPVANRQGLRRRGRRRPSTRTRSWTPPGVAGIGVGVNKAGKAVVKVYKERPDADAPATLDGVEVDSVTTGIIEARAAPT